MPSLESSPGCVFKAENTRRPENSRVPSQARARLLSVAVLLTAAGAHAADAPPSPQHRDGRPLPEVLQLPDGFQPEGIARGRGATLFVAGIGNGAIYKVDARTGQGDFLVPPDNGRKAVGLKLDRRRNRLVVAGGDTGHAYIYDARTGESLADLTLATGGNTFVNDVLLTEDAAFFTESFRPVFYRVPLGCGDDLPGDDDVETIPLGGDYESVAGFNANGIERTPRGDLLIVNGGTGKLYRVDPDSGDARLVDLGGGSVENGDGLVLRGRTLYVVQNFKNTISVLELGRRFSRGEVVEVISDPRFDIPATAAFLKGALYVTNARFSTTPTPDTEYTVVRVPIDD